MTGIEPLAAGAATTSAIIGVVGSLAGVVIGGTITAGVESYRQRQRNILLERAARRLLSDELSTAAALFKDVAETSTVYRDQLLPVAPSWEQYREFMAGHASNDDWRDLSVALSRARRTREALLLVMSDATFAPASPKLSDDAGTSAEEPASAADRLRKPGEPL